MPRLDRERRWRMYQRGCNLLEDLYPQGIDAGPSSRGGVPSMNERNWKTFIIRQPATKARRTVIKQVPVQPERKLKVIE